MTNEWMRRPVPGKAVMIRATRFRNRAARLQARLAADIGELLHDVVKALLDPYRPERYYMRGPGPRWRAKHDRAQRVDAVAVPAPLPRASTAVALAVLLRGSSPLSPPARPPLRACA